MCEDFDDVKFVVCIINFFVFIMVDWEEYVVLGLYCYEICLKVFWYWS